MDDTAREVKSYADGQAGHIRLGCAPTMVKFLLPEIMPTCAPGAGRDRGIALRVSATFWRCCARACSISC